MQAQYELLSQMAKSGQTLNVLQDFFVKFYQAFIVADRWQQYIKGVGTTLLVTAMALALGVVLGSVVAMIRVAHDQQKPHHRKEPAWISQGKLFKFPFLLHGPSLPL